MVVLTIILYIFQSPWRWPVQCVAVTAQAYGLFITWIPAYFENLRSVSKDPVLFYGYFWGWQLPWAILPVIAVLQAGYEVNKAFKAAAKKKVAPPKEEEIRKDKAQDDAAAPKAGSAKKKKKN
eukprot:TRINITY_DN6_c0_g1_i1.p2 TRINITY_DN6_c0_g1~~TRINITY_DN6_c0_g1_i1.p2  ORF type:complete len:123 (-),score=26.16 TRINITY_DN6_c0_g1_i1:80-448(-)